MNFSFESVFGHEYFLSVYGVLIYYTIVCGIEKKMFHTKHPTLKFSFKRWRSDNIVNFMATNENETPRKGPNTEPMLMPVIALLFLKALNTFFQRPRILINMVNPMIPAIILI